MSLKPPSKQYIWLVLFLLCSQRQVWSTTIVTSSGFEQPLFSTGDLFGQQGWTTAGANTGSAEIEFASRNQILRVQRGGGADRRWAVPRLAAPSGRFVSIGWDMAVTLSPEANVFGPFFGVEAYDDFGNFGLLGSFGVDSTTGELLFQEQDTGVLLAPGQTVVSDQWNRYRIELDFQTDTYSAFLNDEIIATTGFVDRGFGLDDFSDADIATFAAAPDPTSQAKSGVALFDNFIVVDGLMGDFNRDDTVDAADFTVWRDHLGAVGVGPADADGNGIVDTTDYEIWDRNFGRSNAVSAPSLAVPEPAPSAYLLSILAVFLMAARKNRLSRNRHVRRSFRFH